MAHIWPICFSKKVTRFTALNAAPPLFNTGRVNHLYQDPHERDLHFILHFGDLTDATNLIRIIEEIKPNEIYNLAAQSHVQVSFETPEYTANADGLDSGRRDYRSRLAL